MTPTDIDALDLMRAKVILATQGSPGKGQPVAPWESQPEAFQARMMEQARAIRQADAAAGVQSVPRTELSAMRDVVDAAKVVAVRTRPRQHVVDLRQALDRLEKRDG